jgi:hypothetical protein
MDEMDLIETEDDFVPIEIHPATAQAIAGKLALIVDAPR